MEVSGARLTEATIDGRTPEILAVGVRPGGKDRTTPHPADDAPPAVSLAADGGAPGAAAGPAVVEPDGAEVAEAFGLDLPAELARARATGAAGEICTVPLRAGPDAADTLLLVGLGDESARSVRQAGAAIARRAKGRDRLAVSVPSDPGGPEFRAFVEGLLLGAYRVPGRGARRTADDAAGSAPDGGAESGGSAVAAVTVLAADPAHAATAIERAVVTATAAERARDLANWPSNEKDPAWLADRAVALGASAGLRVRVRDERELTAEGFAGILAVGAGSVRPPRLVELRYEPPDADRRTSHVVLVGKGITFDSGGLSLKPREAMAAMKTDMTGGGVVIAVLAALRDLEVRSRVSGLVAAAENMPGAAAMRPGDVIRHYGGRTVEVLNTDAEGRLVLADALSYADARLDPDVLIDVATLTGAAAIGLGRRHAALYTADARLAETLVRAGEDSGERVWRMPLVEDYRTALDSPVADLANVTRDKHVGGGSILAALFLREFIGRRRWAHLDIAGPARADADEHEVQKGGTGFGARLLLRWLESWPGRR